MNMNIKEQDKISKKKNKTVTFQSASKYGDRT